MRSARQPLGAIVAPHWPLGSSSPVDAAVSCTALDHALLEGYDPATSFAWPGATPAVSRSSMSADVLLEEQALEGDLFAPSSASNLWFRSAGYSVRPISGAGSTAIIDDFFRATHYTHSAGMNGEAFGLFTGDGALVGCARFARCQNPLVARHMVRLTADDEASLADGRWSALEARHRTVAETEYLDLTRLAVLDVTRDGTPLGTGAESYLIGEALRAYGRRNRALWRAVRKVELGWPVSVAERALLARLPVNPESLKGRGFTKLVRTFADPHFGHTGVIYQAANFHCLGQTTPETALMGIRSGVLVSGRRRGKLHRAQHGHDIAVLLAAWEGADAVLEVREREAPPDAPIIWADLLDWARAVPGDARCDTRLLERRLRLGLRDTISGVAKLLGRGVEELAATTRYLGGGYVPVPLPGKWRYVKFLGAPQWVRELERRCVVLGPALRAAEGTWYSRDRRAPRGHGFGWPRRPARLGAPPYPQPH